MTDQTVETTFQVDTLPPERILVHRHSIWVRVTHWIWAISLVILFMSGMQIFNAHPSLNFGDTSQFDPQATGPPPRLNMDNDGNRGITQVFGHTFDTTGVFGVSKSTDGLAARGMPSWMTLPASQDLATGRRWHFLFAWVLAINGLVYIIYGIARAFRARPDSSTA